MQDLIRLEDFANTMHRELTRVQMLSDATGPFYDAERAAALVEQLATLACTTLLAAQMERRSFEAACPEVEEGEPITGGIELEASWWGITTFETRKVA